MRQSAYPGGMLAALAVLGLIGHLYITDPAAADVPLADYASLAGLHQP
ncbi:hypothetical protein [Glycocaulis alkaliphilus]|nr:hypothetical protein [Glycocaulis alkaliphilus]